MSFQKKSFPAAVITLVLTACGGGGGGNPDSGKVASAAPAAESNPSGSTGPGVIKASNIVLRTDASAAKGGMIQVQANQLPDNVQVLASNVSIVNGSNGLSASNLQSALDQELAVNLPKTIVGIWDIVNLPGNGICAGQSAGRVQINADGTFTMISGAFAAAASFADGESCYQYKNFNFEVAGESSAIVFTRSKPTDPMYPNGPSTTALSIVVKATTNAITLYNGGSLSTLKRVRGTQPVSAKPEPAQTQKSLVALAAQG